MAADLLKTIGTAIQTGKTGGLGKIGAGAQPDGGMTSSFAEALGKLVKSVDTTAGQANTAVDGMLNKTGDVHDAMIALQRSEMTLQLTVQLRNKLVGAYQEIMKMPV
jgi:flagellar hook-basal body complex protein FliE